MKSLTIPQGRSLENIERGHFPAPVEVTHHDEQTAKLMGMNVGAL